MTSMCNCGMLRSIASTAKRQSYKTPTGLQFGWPCILRLATRRASRTQTDHISIMPKKTKPKKVDRDVIWPRVSSARLRRDNHCGIWPLCWLGGDEYETIEGWTPLGWAIAPWKSGGGETHAIVFEKTDHLTSDPQNHFEPGVYWCHGDFEKIRVKHFTGELNHG